MSIFNRIPDHELGTVYTHTGWFLGVVPVYMGNDETGELLLTERNFVPEWTFTLAEGVFILLTALGEKLFGGGYDPCVFIEGVEEIKK